VLPDGDLDGVTDVVEAAAPNGGDGNADGIADSTQAGVASLPAAISSQYVTLVASPGATLVYVTATATLPPNPPVGSSFPLGLLGFALRGVTPGGIAQVTLLLPSGVSINAYHKFGREPGNTTPHWYAFNYNGTTGAQISGATVTLNFVDGQRGDADLAANGMIFDPGGPSFANRPPVITSNGGRGKAAITVRENTTGVTTVTATDADGDALKFSLTRRFDAEKFSIDPRSRGITFRDAPDFEKPADADRDNVYELLVRVDDGQGGQDQQLLRVSVADVRGFRDPSRRS
jgi:hypothetical protein